MKFNLIYLLFVLLFFRTDAFAQKINFVRVTGVLSGSETSNTLFKVTSPTIPSLAYIRAQRTEGPQNGFFTQFGDDIRFTSLSKVFGIPGNLSVIKFTFLQLDKKTPIPKNDFRFIINDIDGPDNEALAVNCDSNIRFLGTSNPTNLTVVNSPITIMSVGKFNESDGATSRVMYEFNDIYEVVFYNYANEGFLKDFDMDNDYPIAKPLYVKCKSSTTSFHTEVDSLNKNEKLIEFKKVDSLTMINTKPIYFDLDKFEIRSDAITELEKVVLIMNKYPEIKMAIRSHTDSRADDEYNSILSKKRAEFVVEWIVKQGINVSRISAKGFGESQLINKCSNGVKCSEEEHQLNRRTEFVIVDPKVFD